MNPWCRLLLLLGTLLPLSGQAQLCLQPYDSASKQIITTGFFCVGQAVQFANCGPPVPTSNLYYDYDARDGFGQRDSSVFHTYTQPGTYRITQIINRPGSPNPDSISRVYVVYPSSTPRVTFFACLRSVQVLLNDPLYPNYSVQFGSAPAQSYVRGDIASSPLLPGSGATTLTIVVRGTTGGKCGGDTALTLSFAPLLALTPRIDSLKILAPTADRQISFGFSRLTAGYAYALERDTTAAAGSWTTVTTLTATAATQLFTLSRADVKQVRRYRLRLLNGACTASAPAPPPVLSNEAGSVPILALVAGPAGTKSLTLRWGAYRSVPVPSGWEVWRNGQRIASLPPNTITYTDTTVSCNRRYCYEVAAVVPLTNPDFNLRARSSDSCATATSDRAPLAASLRASFDLANNLRLTAVVPPTEAPQTFEFRQLPNTSLGTGTNASLLLPTPDTAQVRGTCYTVLFTDSCGNRAPAGPQACPTVLRVRRSPDHLTALLDWTPYVAYAQPTMRYHVLLLDDSDRRLVLRDIPVGSATSYADDLTGNTQQVRPYRIVAEPQPAVGDTTRIAYSNVADLTDEAILRFPTAFTPNGDQLNDTFGPVGRFVLRQVAFQVYDRWGRAVFTTSTPGQAWDGTAPGGTVVTPGAYLWHFRGQDALGRTFNQHGTVTVLQ